MTSFDWRTRTDAAIEPVDPARFFSRELPDLIDRRGAFVVDGARQLAVEPLTIEVEGRCWTLRGDDGQVIVEAGNQDAAALVRFDRNGVSELVDDIRTPMGFATSGTLDMPRGDFQVFQDWWVILRGLVDARPVYTAGSIGFGSADGAPLDVTRSFPADVADAELLQFLDQVGYAHLEGVFSEDEMAAVSAEIDDALPSYVPGDERSWWARTADGTHRPVRLRHFDERSPTTAALLDDDRVRRVARLTGDGHVLGGDQPGENLVEALIKPVGVVDGISDVPWHKDCGLGRHSFQCCALIVGISVTGADADSGQLRAIAGSHRALIQSSLVRPGLDLPAVDLPTRTGDVTVHLSCTLHMSQPPVTHERRVMYTTFRLPDPTGDATRGRRELEAIQQPSLGEGPLDHDHR